jgi:hypothetical protein
MEIFVAILLIYMVGMPIPGISIGGAGEDVFRFSFMGGIFLWPLMLCALLIYGIYTLFRAVIKKIPK